MALLSEYAVSLLSLPFVRPFFAVPIRVLFLLVCLLGSAQARPVEFDVPAQPMPQALLAFARQAGVEVLFSFEAVQSLHSHAVRGRFEPEEALERLLTNSNLVVRRNLRGKFVVTSARRPAGALRGRITDTAGTPLTGADVLVPGLRRSTRTDGAGYFELRALPAGSHQIIATAGGHRSLSVPDLVVRAGEESTLPDIALEPLIGPMHLAPFVVEEQAEERRPFDRSAAPPAPRTAAGNLDLRRTESDVLPFTVFDRDRITRSGVIDLNQFLQRELLESDAGAAAETAKSDSAFGLGGTNLTLRGFGAEETVILVNGRRLPEVLMVGRDESRLPADVSFIPLSLVQRVEVLPASASALYSGNAVGGVINIVLRPDVDVNATEVTTTYTNALHDYDAPQANVSFMHGRSFFNGALRLRLNGNFARTVPPTEAELGYRQQRAEPFVELEDPLYRATPNIRSADGTPLFGEGSSTVTSVPPGGGGTTGLAPFRDRAGLRSEGLFDGPGGMSTSINSHDYAYGRRQERMSWFASTVYDATPWLQLGVDAIYSQTSMSRGYDLFQGDLALAANSALNPFAQDIRVSLLESAPALPEDYNKAKVQFASAVLGALVRLPADWRVMLDTQYARNTVRYRGLGPPDLGRWQALVDQGRYNPLRDTQVFGPPPEFYDQVLIHQGRPGEFATLGDYRAWDSAVRFTHEKLPFPTGEALVNLGGDYRWTRFNDSIEQHYYGDGTPAGDPQQWQGRTLERLSAFGELQAPLIPDAWNPRWLRSAQLELAARYVAADTSQETNFAPTYGLRFDLQNGLSLRGSVTTSNRFPTPQMARLVTGGPGSGGTNVALIQDPKRPNESYEVTYRELINFDLRPEDAVTQTAGVSFQRGVAQRLRVALDFFDTRKNNESIYLETPQMVLQLEEFVPEWVERAPARPDETVGRVTTVTTGRINAAWRHSRNWTASLMYGHDEVLGGTLELYARWMYFEKFEVQYLPNEQVIDQLESPDGGVPGILRHRTNFGVAWSNRKWSVGVDGRYYHERPLPENERVLQGADGIDSHWQFDIYGSTDLKRWVPWLGPRHGLRAQLRVNNVFGPDFPYYWATGVQPYGDWRGRTYALSLTAVF